MDTNADKIARLIEGLQLRGVSGRGMYSRIAEKTGYTSSQVGKVLNGKAELLDRFTNAVCSAFAIDEQWVKTGHKPSFLTATGVYPENSSLTKSRTPPMIHIGPVDRELFKKIADLIACIEEPELREGLKELVKMPEPRRWEAVGMLKRMNEEGKEKGA